MISIYGKLNIKSYIFFANQLKREIDNGSTSIIIDLRDITFADPSGIISMILTIRSLINLYCIKSHIILPNKFDVAKYLLDCGFTRDEGEMVSFEHGNAKMNTFFKILGYDSIKDGFRHYNSIPIIDIVDDNSIETIAREVKHWMVGNNFKENEISDMQVIIYELCQNVKYHSKTKQNGLFFMQGYTPKISDRKKYCMVSIADTGIGIINSLSRNPLYKNFFRDDCEAIRYTLEKGATSVYEEEKFRGNGLKQLLTKTQQKRSNLYVHSNSGIVSYVYDKAYSSFQEKSVIYENSINSFEGTHICFQLICR